MHPLAVKCVLLMQILLPKNLFLLKHEYHELEYLL
ncbi:hypothetical protein LAZ67_X001226 [Cordylochernes scorpioides]|uniref:Uncharacterized protein n=1 Tax=Cordylochernes scorpioides TaxID=51811 RepID=A0ABY6LWC8_9ARAC|nr:hypothetical protein LAZ67_X001226 [Cordylochernes scorpioides]